MTSETDLILSIYDAAIDPTYWPEVLLKVAHFVGARGATVFELDEFAQPGQLKMSMCSENYSSERNMYYLQHYGKEELKDQETFAKHSKRSDGIELIPENVLYADRSEYLKREHVKILRQFEVGYRAAALLNKDLPTMDRFAFQFSSDHGPMGSFAAERSNTVLPHLAKALNVTRPLRELSAEKKAISSSLDMLLIGVCILDNKNNILVSNVEFERQLQNYSVFSRDKFSRLAIDHELAPSLQTLLSSSFQGHGIYGARPRKEAVIFATPSKDRHLCVDVIPCQTAKEFDLGVKELSILFSLDTSRGIGFEPEKIRAIFDLTSSELDVLKLVSEGFTNQQISDQLEKSVHTVDTQIKSILSKSMSSNRTQLVRITSQTTSYISNR